MSRNDPPNVLTPDRYECLRLVSIGATRDAHGVLWEPHPTRLKWLADHGLLAISPAPPGSTREQKRATRQVTALGLRVLELWGKRARVVRPRGVVDAFEFAGTTAFVVVRDEAGRVSRWGINMVSLAADEQIGAAS